MRYVDEYIQNKVNKSVQSHAYEIAEELWDLLEALEKKGFVRESLRGTFEEKQSVCVSAEENADRILAAFNKFYDLYLNKEKSQRFFKFAEGLGFLDEDHMHLIHTQLIFAFLLNIETFKNFLMLVLKNISPKATLGDLFDENSGKLIKATKESGEAEKISRRLDIRLRNSLSHFTFREEGPTISCHYFSKEGKGWVLKENRIQSYELFNKIQEISLMRAIFGSLVVDWFGL